MPRKASRRFAGRLFPPLLSVLICISALNAQNRATPARAEFRGAGELDAAIGEAIRADKLPGAVVLVGHDGKVIYRKAYGNRALVPAKEPMTVDTVFDIASLTKVVATTSGMMKLFEQGKVAMDDPVTRYLPEFQGGSSTITVRDLMTHFSGLRPDLDLEPAWSGYETGIAKALRDKPADAPGAKFVYSDINFELLGEIIRRASGMPENEYLKKILFDPLGMKETGYLPRAALRPRIAPTEMQKDGTMLRGVVHDPTARYMGGVAGHAGVFSTADDLGKFCQMILDGGDGLFSPATIGKFTATATPAGQAVQRGLGWDIQSPYSKPRGELFPAGSFGHTGFTGTSIWIDPASKTYVVLLANSVHPKLRPALTPLRAQVATIVAAAVGYTAAGYAGAERAGGTRTGLDVLAQTKFAALQGKRIGLITNQTGVDREGRRNIDVMRAAGVKIAAIFSPEHGFAGVEDKDNIGDSIDPATGIRIRSLFGKTLRPTPEMLRDVDALVFDIQDLGVRFYTYELTMIYALEEAAKAKKPFYVLDRPNPLTGLHVEGPMLDAARVSNVTAYPLPLRHGLTMGELAKLVNGERRLGAELHVIEMSDWKRALWFDQTGLPWVNPSPNIRSLTEALLYPGLALIEYSTNYSVGRGTDAPFEQVGADWMRGAEVVEWLSGRAIPGVRFSAVNFEPASSNFAGKPIEGVRFEVTDRDIFSPSRLGIELMVGYRSLYPGKIAVERSEKLIGSGRVIREVSAGGDPVAAAEEGLGKFLDVRSKYLIYK